MATPTWIVPLDDGRVGFWTSSRSGKAKRLGTNPHLTIQPSDARGRARAGTSVLAGSAQVVSSGAEFDAISQRVRAKYGMMVPITKLFNTLGHLGKGSFPYADRCVVITLEPTP